MKGTSMRQSGGSHVAIVGAGFGGLWAAHALAHGPFNVTLIDRNNYHTFLPLLYQVAAAELEPEEIIYPVRSILRRLPNVGFLMAEVSRVDLEKRVAETNAGPVAYDYLILATGSSTNFFGASGAEYAYPLKSLDEAIRLRNHILCCFERAVPLSDPQRRRKLLSFAIVGEGRRASSLPGLSRNCCEAPSARIIPNWASAIPR
jgi:NADH dehydrogenase